MAKKTKKKNLGGRPDKFKEEYCEMLIEHMAKGFSYRSFAGVIGIAFKTLYNWEESYPEFLHAKSIGASKSLYAYEKIGLAASHGKIPGFNATAYVWFGKNVHSWRDKQDVDITSSDGSARPVINITIPSNGREAEEG